MLNAASPLSARTFAVPPAAAHGAAWETLEHLFDFLHGDEQPGAQLRRVLRDVREILDADVVYFHPGESGESFELAGSPAPSAEWCQQFTLRALGSSPGIDRELVRSNLPPLSGCSLEQTPRSVAMVRLSKTGASWLVALSYRTERGFGAGDVRIMSLCRKMLMSQRQQARAREKWHATLLGLIHCLTAAVEAKEPHTKGHSERVARMAVRLGQEMQLSAEIQSDLYLAGLLHDLGKIGVPDAVLLKPGPLTEEERARVKEHAAAGDRILAKVAPLSHLRPGVRHHHERWDGAGYPDGLAGEAVPLLARVLAVADACEAMTSARPYRDARPLEAVEAIMAAGAGSQWDPAVAAAFASCSAELLGIGRRDSSESPRADHQAAEDHQSQLGVAP